MTLIEGLFEIHVTVKGGEGVEKFKDVCKELRLKPVLIELPYGQTQEQLMTSSWARGNEETAVEEAKKVASALHSRGFQVVRVKVEATASNRGVPQTPPDDPQRYFEFHVKMLVEDEERLRALVAPHHGHLSRNSLKGEKDVKFITLRVYGKGKVAAFADLEALLLSLKDEKVLAVHREYAVYDTNVELDSGWIDRLRQSA
ncbi:Ankyrin repeat-containing protein [Balamuthia mandrillaris]